MEQTSVDRYSLRTLRKYVKRFKKRHPKPVYHMQIDETRNEVIAVFSHNRSSLKTCLIFNYVTRQYKIRLKDEIEHVFIKSKRDFFDMADAEYRYICKKELSPIDEFHSSAIRIYLNNKKTAAT